MIASWWIFVALAIGGCTGLLLAALLRIAADESPDALLLARCNAAAPPENNGGESPPRLHENGER